MSIISRLGVVLGLDSGEFQKGIGLANKSLLDFATVGNAAKLGVIEMSKQLLQFADQIQDVAAANDVSIASIVKLNIALQQSGGQAESAGRLFSALSNKIDEAAQGSDKARATFAKIGITLKDIKTLSAEDLFAKTIRGLSGMEDSITRNATAFEVLGRNIRGVDLKSLNENIQKNTDLANSAQSEIDQLGTSWDNLGASFYRLKVVFVDLFGPIISAATDFFSWLLDVLTDILTVINKISEAMGKGFKWLLDGKLGEAIRDAKKSQQQLMNDYQGAQAPNFGVASSANRDTTRSETEKKIADEIERQNKALNQQLLTYQYEIKYVGKVKDEYDKLRIEFEKGGKYALVSKQKQIELSNKALELDKANRRYYLQTELEREKNAQDILNLEIKISGQSDTQRAKQIALLKVEQDIAQVKKSTKLSPEELRALEEAKKKTIELQEAAQRTANTFQNGFSRAFENWKEKATDSFALGEQAFTSMTDSMTAALDEFVNTGKISFGSLIRSMILNLIKLQMQAQVSGFFSMIGSALGLGGGASGGSMTSIAPSAGGLKLAFADGGDPPLNTPSLVGERGPELFVPKQAGTIIPNNKLSSVMGSNKPQIVYNGPYIHNMSAIDTQSATQFLAKNKQGVWAANQSAQRGLPQSR